MQSSVSEPVETADSPNFPASADAIRAAPFFNEDWYYQVELAPGIITPGQHGGATILTRRLLERCDLVGARCLDIGPMEGLITAMMARRGAAELVAMDITLSHQRKLAALQHYLGFNAQLHAPLYLCDAPAYFEQRGVPAFDSVIFSGVLYHVADFTNSLASARSLLRPGGIMIVETWLGPGDDYSIQFNVAGSVTHEVNTFWFPTVNLFDYLLRMYRLQILDCVFFRIEGHGYRLAVACRGVNRPVAADGDTWIDGAGMLGVDTDRALKTSLGSAGAGAADVEYKTPHAGPMHPGTQSLHLAPFVADRESEIAEQRHHVLMLRDSV